MAQYGIFFTQLGRSKIASATASQPLEITHIAIGDGGGGYPSIDDEINSLVNELGRYPISNIYITNPTQRQFTADIDTSIGPATIRERGLIDSVGDLIAIAQAEPIEIPSPGGAHISDIQISILATFNNTEHVRAIVDLNSTVRTKRKIIAGEGMDGGGDLSSDITIKAKFGTEAGTVAEGNDSRITGAAAKTYVDTELSKKVNAVAGKGLSTNDYTATDKNAVNTISNKADKTYVDNQLTNKLNTSSKATEAEAKAGTNNTKYMTPLSTRQAISAIETYQPERIFGAHLTRNWTTLEAPEANQWHKIIWIKELKLFVAVSRYGTNCVMTSPDGRVWTARQAPESNYWNSIAWSPELSRMVAVSSNGNNLVMTSSNGTYWVVAQAAESNFWYSVTWSPELGMFVAVAASGNNRVMTSNNGANWISRNAPLKEWRSVTWSPKLGLFVAVGSECFMTSTNGIAWTERVVSHKSDWNDVAWSQELGIFVAVSSNSSMRFITSNDGINWTPIPSSAQGLWESVIWAKELGMFVAIGGSSSNSIAYSYDGINWVYQPYVEPGRWVSVAWSPELGLLAAVGNPGAHRIMFSS